VDPNQIEPEKPVPGWQAVRKRDRVRDNERERE